MEDQDQKIDKTNLYVGNLPYEVDTAKLIEMFSTIEGVEVDEENTQVITFKDTGKSKGFGFVKVQTEEMAEKAIEEMNEKEIESGEGREPRKIFVNVARPKAPRRDDE